MGRIGRITTAIFLASVGVAAAGTGFRLDLGVGGELWREERGTEALTSEQETLRAAIDLVLSGHVLDPRFLTFQLGVHGSLYRIDSVGGGSSTTRPLAYDGRISAFSNRLISVDVMAVRQTTETMGDLTTAVGGTRTSKGATLSFRPKGLPSVVVRHSDFAFEADDPTTFRDEDSSVDALESRWRPGRFDLALDARLEERSYSGGRVLNDFQFGNLSLDYNRAGDNRFFTILQLSSSDTTVNGIESPSTTSLISKSLYSRRLSENGRLNIRLNHQESGYGDDTVTNDQFAVGLYRSLSERFSLEAQGSYLVGENSAGESIRQPAMMLGVPWSFSKEKVHYALTPRVTYTGRPVESDEADSRFGGMINGSIRWYRGASSLALEAEVLRNNLSIVPLGPGGGPGGGTLLAGLEKEHAFARFTIGHHFVPNLHIEAAGEFWTRTRVFQGGEADESEARAHLGVRWRRFSLRSAASSFDVTGGDFPRTRESVESSLFWRPKSWLQCYLRRRSEDSTDPAISSAFSRDEAGIDFRYGKLIFYTRWQRETTTYDGDEPFENERIWVGFKRWFGMNFGESAY